MSRDSASPSDHAAGHFYRLASRSFSPRTWNLTQGRQVVANLVLKMWQTLFQHNLKACKREARINAIIYADHDYYSPTTAIVNF